VGLADHPGPGEHGEHGELLSLFVDEFVATVAPAYLGSWDAVNDLFATDPAELDTVNALRASVREHGLLQPVHVTRGPDGKLTLVDGMHRVIAAYLEGADVIFTVTDAPTPAAAGR
jgi:hypothetical protein